MLPPTSILFQGSRYVLLERPTARSEEPEQGRVLSRGEVQRLFTSMIREQRAADVRRLYVELTHAHLTPHTTNDAVVRALTAFVAGSSGGRISVMEVQSFGRQSNQRVEPTEGQKEARNIDVAIARLGASDVMHRGSAYRVTRAAKASDVPNRQMYETLSQRESLALLKEMAEEPLRSEAQKSALKQLAELAAQKPQGKGNELLMLRRQRTYITGPAPEVITPSKLRQPKKHKVDLVLVEEWGNPTLNTFTYQLTMDDGTTLPGSFDSAGEAHHADLTTSSGKVQLKNTHPDEWRVRAERPVGYLRKGFGMTLVDAHGVPIGGYAFEAAFDNGVSLQGQLDASGFGELADTPSYPLTLKVPAFDAEDWAK